MKIQSIEDFEYTKNKCAAFHHLIDSSNDDAWFNSYFHINYNRDRKWNV